MRLAHSFSPLILVASLSAATMAPAQPAAADASATSTPLRHSALPGSGTVETETTDWRRAHDAVGAFPRGHADIVRWEAEQARQGGTTPAAQPPAPATAASDKGPPHEMHHHMPQSMDHSRPQEQKERKAMEMHKNMDTNMHKEMHEKMHKGAPHGMKHPTPPAPKGHQNHQGERP